MSHWVHVFNILNIQRILSDFNGKDVNVIVSYPYEKHDEFVFKKTFEQSKIYGDDNNAASGEWKRYYNDNRDFWITLAVK